MERNQTEHYWQSHIAEWRKTNLSLAAYSRRQALAYHQLTYWKRKLDQPVPCAIAESNLMTGFTRVISKQVVQESTLTDQPLIVTLPTGVKITGLHAGNIELLGAVVRQL